MVNTQKNFAELKAKTDFHHYFRDTTNVFEIKNTFRNFWFKCEKIMIHIKEIKVARLNK